MPDSVLVGDIGGTNVRFGRARLGFAGHPEVEDIAVLPGDSFGDRKSTRLNSSHPSRSRMPSSA